VKHLAGPLHRKLFHKNLQTQRKWKEKMVFNRNTCIKKSIL